MKVAVNGSIIDTKNIYMITPVTKEEDYIDDDIWAKYFTIVMFNNVRLEVYSKTEPNNIILLESTRQTIVDLWLADQSELLQINL
jgi:hypothetical protein